MRVKIIEIIKIKEKLGKYRSHYNITWKIAPHTRSRCQAVPKRWLLDAAFGNWPIALSSAPLCFSLQPA